jgi:hypothetical protein
MSFLQPLILLALPLMALPVVIHLIHQYRHRTVQWAAMMFLVQARRMNQGMARLRYLLIMLMRMLAIGALVFAISRPLASGWLSGAGMSARDVTLVLLDRSPSMETRDLQTGESKRSIGLKKLADFLDKRGFGSRLVLLDSASGQTHTLDSPETLLNHPFVTATAASADIPGMLERGLSFLKADESGRADIWIISDLAENDWDAGSGRWTAIQRLLTEMKGTHVFLLSYADRSAPNESVRVEKVKSRLLGGNAELVLDVMLRAGGDRAGPEGGASLLPVEFEVNGVRSVVELEAGSRDVSLEGHVIPIEEDRRTGWGKVSIPGDSNPEDNCFYFVFSEPAPRNAVIVTDDRRIGQAFRTALAIPVESGVEQAAEVFSPDRAGMIDWESAALLVWHAPLPDGVIAEQVERFVASGRTAFFFPPGEITDRRLFGVRWAGWGPVDPEQGMVTWWRSDSDLLAHSEGGNPLPLNELKLYQMCAVDGPGTELARIGDHQRLLIRPATDRGSAYFCGTLPVAQFSSLEMDGVVFYVMLQRALMEGSRALSAASPRKAEIGALEDRAWERVAPLEDTPMAAERDAHAGVYRDGGFWTALNRSGAEDQAGVVSHERVDALFEGIAYERIDDSVDDRNSLASEIWRLFLLAMALFLMAEALLSMPEKSVERKRFSGFQPSGASMEAS